MILGMIFFSLLAMILVMILYETLQSDIGRNLLKEEGEESLGMRARNEELVGPPKLGLC